jgi:hypothetical protein
MINHKISVNFEVTPYRSEIFLKYIDRIGLQASSTIYELLDELYRSYLIGDEYYDNRVGLANIFWGYLLYKSGEFIGYFDRDGFKARRGANIVLADGDRIIVTPPIGGG